MNCFLDEICTSGKASMIYIILTCDISRWELVSGIMPDHMQCRRKVCAVCWNRSSKKIDTVIEAGSKFEAGLKEHVDSEFSADDLKCSVSKF